MIFRLKAFLIHLFLSVLIVGGVSYISLSVWFPYPLYMIDGTWVAVAILASIDFIVGPVITLVIASAKKSRAKLYFNYAVIGCMQLCALLFGLSQVYDQRIIALIHIGDNFHLVSAQTAILTEENTNIDRYNGIYYGMLEYIYFEGLNADFWNMKSNTIAEYRQPTREVLAQGTLPKRFIPDAVYEQYGEKALYKAIVGKKRDGVAVFNSETKIVDIALTKELQED